MKHLSISQAWRETQASLSHNRRIVIALAGVFFVLPTALLGFAYSGDDTMGALVRMQSSPLAWLAQLVEIVGMVGTARLALGPPTTVGAAVTLGLRRLPQVLLAILVALLPMAIAVTMMLLAKSQEGGALALLGLLLWVAGVIVLVRLSIIPAVAAMEEGWAVTILKRSWALTRGSAGRLFLVLTLLMLTLLVLTVAVGITLGLLAKATGMATGAMSFGALLVSLASGLVRAGFLAVTITLFARIAAQLAARRG